MKTLKIIKIGGNIIDDNRALKLFLSQFAQLKGPKILVHGGGKLATKMAQKMNIPVIMSEGRRITDESTLDIITMVYAGKINKNIVAQLQANHCNALGFSGADGNSIVSVKRPIKTIDYGFVGDVKQVNTNTIASELAIGFSKLFKTELYYCFEKNGVLRDITDDNSVVKNINTKTYKILIHDGSIADGMLPKLNNCFHAINNSVDKVCIGKTNMLFAANTLFTTIQK
jgi:acetylglutamate kinase